MINRPASFRASRKASAAAVLLRHDGFDAGQPKARSGQLVADEDGSRHISRPG